MTISKSDKFITARSQIHGVSNHQQQNWLFERLFTPATKNPSKFHLTVSLCGECRRVGDKPVHDGFPSPRALMRKASLYHVYICCRFINIILIYFADIPCQCIILGSHLCRMCLQEVQMAKCEWKVADGISSNNNQQFFKTGILQWLAVSLLPLSWQNQVITWIDGDPLSNIFYGITISAFSRKVLANLICNVLGDRTFIAPTTSPKRQRINNVW